MRSISCRKVTKMTLSRAHRTSMSQIVGNKQKTANAYHTVQPNKQVYSQKQYYDNNNNNNTTC